MDFEWSLYSDQNLPPDEVSESFEDPFSIRLLPDSPRFSAQIRFFSLGSTRTGKRIFAVYTSTGKIVKVVCARLMTPAENTFYDRKSHERL